MTPGAVNHKISAPALPAGIVQRARLFHLLEKSAEKRVTWISGPGGSGKTTLASSYLASRKLPAIWYQIDRGDADPAAFFYYLGRAFKGCASPDEEPLPLLTPEYLGGIKTFARRYFQELCARLAVPSAIVLDNYQDISPSSPFHELMMEGFSVIPQGITVLVLSRSEPPPVFTRHDAVQRFAFLGWSDLRFSYDEASQFASLYTESTLETESLARLYTKTDGWIAGLLLILESLKGSSLDDDLLENLPLDRVFGYFADKIFEQSDRLLQEFLLKTAVAQGITVQMAEQLTGIGISEQILARLCRNRFFTGRLSPSDPVYQYHPLFREFLLARAEQTFTALELREIRRKAATILRDAGRKEDAADLLIEAADWDGVTELVLEAAPVLASEGRSETLYGWLQSMPVETVESVAGLLYWKGVCLLLHSPPQSRLCFRRALDGYRQANDRVGMLISWIGGAGVSVYDGEFAPLDQWLALLPGMQLDEVAFPSQELEHQVAMSIFNAMAFRQPQHPDIARWRERGAPVVRGAADINFRLQSGVQLLVHDLWGGNFARATFMLEQVLDMARSRRITPMSDITIRNAQALHAFFTGAWSSGVTVAIDAVRLADETGVQVLDCQLLGNGASCALCLGDGATAEVLLKKMENCLGQGWRKFDLAYFHMLRGWQRSSRNEFQAASQHLELTLEGFHGAGFLGPEALALDVMVQNLLEVGDTERAGHRLAQAYDIAYGMKSRFLAFLCLCTGVHQALAANQEPEAIGLLRQAMALGSAGGYVGSWVWYPALLLRLCVKALEYDIEVDYVRGLIRRWSLVPETPPLHLDAWPWPFKILTFGGFQLMRDHEPVVLAGRTKKPLELLKALVAFGGKEVSQERLTDAIWPDADGDLAQRSFDTTLHRLRKLMGHEKALLLQGGRLSINSRYCWVDTWAFQARCAEGMEAALHTGQTRDAVALPPCFEKGIALYAGAFLPEDADQAWSFGTREQLRGKYLQLLTRGGAWCEALGLWERALAWYRKGLEEEPRDQEFLRGSLACQRQLGQAAPAAQR